MNYVTESMQINHKYALQLQRIVTGGANVSEFEVRMVLNRMRLLVFFLTVIAVILPLFGLFIVIMRL